VERFKRFPDGVYNEGLMRFYPGIHDIPKVWRFNKLFVACRGKKYFNEETGEITFPTSINKGLLPKKYYTIFGWFFPCGGIVWGDFNENYTGGVSRHFQLFEPKSDDDQDELGNLFKYGILVDKYDFHKRLNCNQDFYFRDLYNSNFRSLIEEELGEHQQEGDMIDLAKALTLESHPKMVPRQEAFKNLVISGDIYKGDMWADDSTRWKLKMIEIAKQSKYARVIVDFGIENSLATVPNANSIKKHTKGKTIWFGDVSVRYNGESNPVLISLIFEKIWFESRFDKNKITIDNDSDDAIICINGLVYNVDISSNDASHSYITHEFFAYVMRMSEEQKHRFMCLLRSKFKVFSDDMKHSISFESLRGYLPSGIGHTSVKNNFIYMILAFELNNLLLRGFKPEISLVTLAGYNIGFRFSYQLCEEYFDMQFLKHSPVKYGNGLFAIHNLGVLLRYSGKVEGDVSPSTFPLSHRSGILRFAFFQTLLTYGFFKYVCVKELMPLCPCFDLLFKGESNFHKPLLRHSKFDTSLNLVERPRITISIFEILKRYRLDDYQIHEFVDYVAQSGFGRHIFCSASDTIFKIDYGLKF